METGNAQLSNQASSVLDALEGLLPQSEIQEVAKEIPGQPTPGSNPPEGGGEGASEGGNSEGSEGGAGTEGQQGAEGGQEGAAAQEGEAGQGAEGGEEEGAEKNKGAEGKTPTTEKQSRLGLKKPGQKSEIVIEKVEDVLGVVKSRYGQDLKDIKELPKFFESVDKMRVAAQKADVLEKENNTFRELWEKALPPEFIEAAKLHVNGEDYMKAFASRPKVDLNTPIEKQDISKLVNEYFPGKFTKEDFEEEVKSPALDIAIQASKDKFVSQKKEFDTRRASIEEKAAKTLELQQRAVESSVESLKKSFPLVDEGSLNEVSSILKGGVNEVISLLFDENGVAKPEAAEMLFMAKYGKEEIEVASEIAANRAESRVNEEIVSRGADTKKPVQKTGVAPQLSKEAQKTIQELEEIKKQTGNTF